MHVIHTLKAREIIDSRGIPTIELYVWLDNGIAVSTAVPAGALNNKNEAVELRDNDPNRYFGMGVQGAIKNIETEIYPRIRGLDPVNQEIIDKLMIDLDGTKNKSRLGANAILSVSQAICKAAAAALGVPVYQYLLSKYNLTEKIPQTPVPVFNVINGGKHGAGNLDFQEFHIIPSSRYPYHEALRIGIEIYHSLEKALIHNNAIHSVGIEGGFAPNLFTNLDALEVIFEAIKLTPYTFGHDVFLGLDVAASYFHKNGKYSIRDRSKPFSSNELIEYYKELNNQYHVFSLEDPLSESDWDSWSKLTSELSRNTMIVGDDLLATNKENLQKAINEHTCTGILVKPNQVGSITETIEVVKLAKSANLSIIASHRSGETIDSFIADFAVGIGADYAKFGAPVRGERVAKYNRLLQIDSELTALGHISA